MKQKPKFFGFPTLLFGLLCCIIYIKTNYEVAISIFIAYTLAWISLVGHFFRKKSMKYKRANLSPRKRLEILKRDGFRCHSCGATAKTTCLDVNHKVPISKGGTNNDSNLITLCFKCNRGAGNSIFVNP